jgi:small GTP-binding protein
MSDDPSDESNEVVYNIVTVGDSAVGKTCIVNRFLGRPFAITHLTTIGIDKSTYKIEKDGINYVLKFWDTTGQERFANLAGQYFRKADYVCFVYAINDTKSFDNINKWLNNLKNVNSNSRLRMALIANKCDLEEERKINKEDGEGKAKELQMSFFETSAKMETGIKQCFDFIINDVINANIDKARKKVHTITLENANKNKGGCCAKNKNK